MDHNAAFESVGTNAVFVPIEVNGRTAHELEDVMHFVAQCPKLLQYRKDFLNNLLKLFPADDVTDRFLIQNCFHDNLNFLNLRRNLTLTQKISASKMISTA